MSHEGRDGNKPRGEYVYSQSEAPSMNNKLAVSASAPVINVLHNRRRSDEQINQQPTQQ